MRSGGSTSHRWKESLAAKLNVDGGLRTVLVDVVRSEHREVCIVSELFAWTGDDQGKTDMPFTYGPCLKREGVRYTTVVLLCERVYE